MLLPGDGFGETLGPAVLAACSPHLRDLRWFRTDWQRGGALTATAEWGDLQSSQSVVIKLPVTPLELLWLERLQNSPHACVPDLLADGRELGGYDFAWVVMKQLAHGPLDRRWNGAEHDLLCHAAARFYAASSAFSVDAPPRIEHWEHTIDQSRRAVRSLRLAQGQRWSYALKTLQKKLPKALGLWNGRPIDDWCHGDLHYGNAMTDAPPPLGPALLFDLARVHAGHWVEDAVYFESQHWGAVWKSVALDACHGIAAHRKAMGLHNDADWPRLANIRRVLLAAASPLQQATRPDPAHLQAALPILEHSLKHI